MRLDLYHLPIKRAFTSNNLEAWIVHPLTFRGVIRRGDPAWNYMMSPELVPPRTRSSATSYFSSQAPRLIGEGFGGAYEASSRLATAGRRWQWTRVFLKRLPGLPRRHGSSEDRSVSFDRAAADRGEGRSRMEEAAVPLGDGVRQVAGEAHVDRRRLTSVT